MTDIVERLRDHDRHVRGRLIEGLSDLCIDDMVEAANEIEWLRNRLRNIVPTILKWEHIHVDSDGKMHTSDITKLIAEDVESFVAAALGEGKE